MDTGCRLDLEKGPTGICFLAMSSEGECIGRRHLSTVQLANEPLVQAVMFDFIAQTKRLLESRGKESGCTQPRWEMHANSVAGSPARRD